MQDVGIKFDPPTKFNGGTYLGCTQHDVPTQPAEVIAKEALYTDYVNKLPTESRKFTAESMRHIPTPARAKAAARRKELRDEKRAAALPTIASAKAVDNPYAHVCTWEYDMKGSAQAWRCLRSAQHNSAAKRTRSSPFPLSSRTSRSQA